MIPLPAKLFHFYYHFSLRVLVIKLSLSSQRRKFYGFPLPPGAWDGKPEVGGLGECFAECDRWTKKCDLFFPGAPDLAGLYSGNWDLFPPPVCLGGSLSLYSIKSEPYGKTKKKKNTKLGNGVKRCSTKAGSGVFMSRIDWWHWLDLEESWNRVRFGTGSLWKWNYTTCESFCWCHKDKGGRIRRTLGTT